MNTQESYLCDKSPIDRHLTIRVSPELMAGLIREKEILEFPYVSSLVRHLLFNRARTTGLYSKEELSQIRLEKDFRNPRAMGTRLSIKVTKKIYEDLVRERKEYEFKNLSKYVIFILERRFLKTGALRRFKNLEKGK